MNYIKKLYLNELTEPHKSSLWKAYYTELSKAIDIGLNQTEGFNANEIYTDALLRFELQKNIAVFSAFKNHSFKNELVKLLIDENGDVRSWSSFKKEALQLSDTYNQVWLKTEYDHAVLASHMASKWQDFKDRKHLYPNLKYLTVGDNRVRELHSKWHNLVLPIDHKFWDTHLPPNDWGCRCDVIQTDEPIDTKSLEVDDMPNLPKMFNNNVGKTGKIVDNKNHPYASGIPNQNKLKKEAEKKVNRTPQGVENYEKKLDVKVDRKVFQLLNNPVLFTQKNLNRKIKSKGAYFSPSDNYVKIPIDARRKNSKWYAESVVYHEFGHAIDHQKEYYKSKGIKELMDKYRKVYAKDKAKRFKELDSKLHKLAMFAYKRSHYDFFEKIGACLDTLMSLNYNYGSGHTKTYFKTKWMSEKEFIAHLFENKFKGNEVFKKYMPELYKEMESYKLD